MKKIITTITVTLMLIAALAGCVQQPVETQQEKSTSAPELINMPKMSLNDYPKIDGSTANLPLALALIQAVTGCDQKAAENATFFTTTDPSYESLVSGEADMLLAYEASDTTKRELMGYDSLEIQPIGRDALVFLVNEDNPVQSITSDQLRGIYSGEITNWKQIGGDDLEIMAFQRQEKSGSQTLMKKLVMSDVDMIEAEENMIAIEMRGLIDVIGSFNASSNAIGYSVYYYAHNMYEIPDVRLISVDGIMPSNETIQSGEYPYINEFFCVLPKNPKQNARLIADWLVSDEGQFFIKENGYVSVS